MASEWYYTTNKQQMGPVSWDELRELAEVGILKPHDMVWAEGMDEWVKAINQSGLFAGEDDGVTADPKAKKKPTYGDVPKPPPGRRTRRNEEEEEEEEEGDDKDAKRKARKREEDRAKWGVGFRVALGIGAVVGLLLLGTCVCGGIAYMTWGGDAPRPKPGGNPGPAPGGLVRDNFTWNNLNERAHLEKSYQFTGGKRVVITVTNNLPNPNTNVDVMVFRGGGMNQNQNTAMQWDRRLPQQDRNCRLDFIVPANDIYWLRVANFGPGIANSCQVTVTEQ